MGRLLGSPFDRPVELLQLLPLPDTIPTLLVLMKLVSRANIVVSYPFRSRHRLVVANLGRLVLWELLGWAVPCRCLSRILPGYVRSSVGMSV